MMRAAKGEGRKPALSAAEGAKGETQNPKPKTHPSSLISHPSSRNAEFYRQKAIDEFTHFIGHFPESPLAHTAARAIADLNGGKLPARAGALYAHALRLEEKKRKEERLARAQCGPEALRWMLEKWSDGVMEKWSDGKEEETPTLQHSNTPTLPSVKELARACGTTERGTTLFDLARVARQYGLRVSGVQATWEGLQQIRPPAILLLGSHYVVLTQVDKRGITVVDPAQSVNESETNQRMSGSIAPCGRCNGSLAPCGRCGRLLPAGQFKPPWQGYLLVIHGWRK